MFKVGDEVVVFHLSSPLQHNSQHSPKHPCRGKVLKVGKKWVQIESTGGPIKVAIDNGLEYTFKRAFPVKEAREMYGKELKKYGKTAAQIKHYVGAL